LFLILTITWNWNWIVKASLDVMLKSTYKPSANRVAQQASLPPGWTEHTAPTGHIYYYNAETKESTYKRPVVQAIITQQPPILGPTASTFPYQSFPSLSDPATANAFVAQLNSQNQPQHSQGRRQDGKPQENRPRAQPVDKPISKAAIPDAEPWILVHTKYGRRFVYNPIKNASYWRIPDKLKPCILKLDQDRILNKAIDKEESHGAEQRGEVELGEDGRVAADLQNMAVEDDSSEYEEVEVTDDEEDEDGDEHRNKRQRTEEADNDEPVEFNEMDIAFQLQAMGEEYGLDPEDYDDGNLSKWPDGSSGVEFSKEDAQDLFKDLLNDFSINPYSPWEKLVEEGRLIDDPRYTVLSTMKDRKQIWEEWSKEKIKEIREQRAREEKKDPRIPYLALLQKHATPKLYWPEFKRKYKKEEALREPTLSDKDKEKWYREFISRTKLSQTTLKSDMTALLKSLPLYVLNNKTLSSHLPPQVLTDMRYVSLEPKLRDGLIEAYIQTLGPPPSDNSEVELDASATKTKEARQRRELALKERDKSLAEQKRRAQTNIERGRARLRDEGREIEMAKQIGKQGLQSQLASLADTHGGDGDMDRA
jgi:hypothetical protein